MLEYVLNTYVILIFLTCIKDTIYIINNNAVHLV